VFAPLLVMLGRSGKRRTDRLILDLAELGAQMSFAGRAAWTRSWPVGGLGAEWQAAAPPAVSLPDHGCAAVGPNVQAVLRNCNQRG
jgi:hypothetical protein